MLYKNVVLHVSELRGNIVITVKHAFCVWIEDGIRVENVPVSTCSVTNRHDIVCHDVKHIIKIYIISNSSGSIANSYTHLRYAFCIF